MNSLSSRRKTMQRYYKENNEEVKERARKVTLDYYYKNRNEILKKCQERHRNNANYMTAKSRFYKLGLKNVFNDLVMERTEVIKEMDPMELVKLVRGKE